METDAPQIVISAAAQAAGDAAAEAAEAAGLTAAMSASARAAALAAAAKRVTTGAGAAVAAAAAAAGGGAVGGPPPNAVPLPVLVEHSHTNTQLLIYGGIFLLSLVPGSILLVAKEYVYKAFDMDVVYLSAWVSNIQVIISFAIVPLAVIADGTTHSHTHTPHRRDRHFDLLC